MRTSQECGAATKDASANKIRKHECLTDQNYNFKALAFENLGP